MSNDVAVNEYLQSKCVRCSGQGAWPGIIVDDDAGLVITSFAIVGGSLKPKASDGLENKGEIEPILEENITIECDGELLRAEVYFPPDSELESVQNLAYFGIVVLKILGFKNGRTLKESGKAIQSGPRVLASYEAQLDLSIGEKLYFCGFSLLSRYEFLTATVSGMYQDDSKTKLLVGSGLIRDGSPAFVQRNGQMYWVGMCFDGVITEVPYLPHATLCSVELPPQEVKSAAGSMLRLVDIYDLEGTQFYLSSLPQTNRARIPVFNDTIAENYQEMLKDVLHTLAGVGLKYVRYDKPVGWDLSQKKQQKKEETCIIELFTHNNVSYIKPIAESSVAPETVISRDEPPLFLANLRKLNAALATMQFYRPGFPDGKLRLERKSIGGHRDNENGVIELNLPHLVGAGELRSVFEEGEYEELAGGTAAIVKQIKELLLPTEANSYVGVFDSVVMHIGTRQSARLFMARHCPPDLWELVMSNQIGRSVPKEDSKAVNQASTVRESIIAPEVKDGPDMPEEEEEVANEMPEPQTPKDKVSFPAPAPGLVPCENVSPHNKAD